METVIFIMASPFMSRGCWWEVWNQQLMVFIVMKIINDSTHRFSFTVCLCLSPSLILNSYFENPLLLLFESTLSLSNPFNHHSWWWWGVRQSWFQAINRMKGSRRKKKKDGWWLSKVLQFLLSSRLPFFRSFREIRPFILLRIMKRT